MPERAPESGAESRALILACALALIPTIAVFAFFGLKRAGANDLPTAVTISVCNDGLVGPAEICDAGAGNNIGSYSSTTAGRVCAPGCHAWGPYCGDGVLQVRFGEQCDQGGSNSTSGLCSPSCVTIPPAPPPGAPSRGSTPDIPGAIPGLVSAEKETRVVIRGKAYPLSSVSILHDGKKVGTAIADSNADFLFSSAAIPPGTATLGFVGADRTGTQSITTSVVFEVVQSAITTVANVFLPPTIMASSQRVEPGDPLTLSGFTVPRATVSVVLDNAKTPITATSSDDGSWALRLDTATIAPGFHAAKASFTLSSLVKSGYGRSLSLYIGTELPAGSATQDLNGDGKVNLVDFSIFLLAWGTDDPRSDFSGDGKVNLADFSILLFAWTG